MTTAFVLSGGGNLGAVQVGMLQALAERRMVPDLLVGTSAGALNAVFVAERGPRADAIDALAQVWASLRARDLFPLDPRGLLGGTEAALCSDRGLRRLLGRQLGIERLDQTAVPVRVIATDFLSGEEVVIDEGDATTAVLASCAIPGVFPPVMRAGRPLVDGGLADNAAISQAVAAGADTVVVLPAGYACALPAPPRRTLPALCHALSLLTHQRLVADVRLYAERVELVVLAPPCPLSVAPLDFGRSRELVARARSCALRQLSVDGGRRRWPAEAIAPHRHGESIEPDPAAVTAARTRTPRAE